MASSTSVTTDDDELTLPRASINKMIKEILPNIRVANESRELILNCCTEFIHLLSSEANDICNTQQKKTINAEHVLQALDRLGFGDYRADAEAVLRDCKAAAAKRRRQSMRLENLGIPEEELLRQQQELFAKDLRTEGIVNLFQVNLPSQNEHAYLQPISNKRNIQKTSEERGSLPIDERCC
ncbi:hypothetical protein R5R35_004193 [Gryllus longicercus]|uniref:Protein Dr1 n=1 Tax=Gryllus longicercus TaxID=2509291 RepID=A0AAN9VH98_9ORTH